MRKDSTLTTNIKLINKKYSFNLLKLVKMEDKGEETKLSNCHS